jgi:restriction endonuclease Mrr
MVCEFPGELVEAVEIGVELIMAVVRPDEPTVTKGEGVDVWADRRGDRIAIQVKQRGRSNKIGRPPLQKIASTIPKGDADRVIVVTNSDFGQTARDYADEFGPTMDLIDGAELIQILTESDLPPPVSK